MCVSFLCIVIRTCCLLKLFGSFCALQTVLISIINLGRANANHVTTICSRRITVALFLPTSKRKKLHFIYLIINEENVITFTSFSRLQPFGIVPTTRLVATIVALSNAVDPAARKIKLLQIGKKKRTHARTHEIVNRSRREWHKWLWKFICE